MEITELSIMVFLFFVFFARATPNKDMMKRVREKASILPSTCPIFPIAHGS